MIATTRRLGSALLLVALVTNPAPAAGTGFHGRVLANYNGLIVPVRGATVEFMDPAGRVAAKVETDEFGNYRADLISGTYTYAVHRDELLPENAGRAVALQLSDGYAVCDFCLVPGKAGGSTPPLPPPSAVAAKLGGRVYEKGKDGKLVGVSGAVISLRPSAGGAITTVVTGRSGSGGYEVILSAGAWRASAQAAGFETSEVQPIDVSADMVTGRDFVLTRQPVKKDR